jgi:DNA-binding beta-propeller fold protein YncE
MGRYDSVKVYNGANFQLITTVNIPDSNTHTTIERVGVTVNSNSNRVYATWRGANTLYMIDGNNHTIIKTVTPPTFSDTVMVNPYTNFVYVGTAVLNGETLEVVAQNYTGVK